MQPSAWEQLTDKVEPGKCYELKNVTVRIFADIKYLNNNGETQEIEVEDPQLSALKAQDTAPQGHPAARGVFRR